MTDAADAPSLPALICDTRGIDWSQPADGPLAERLARGVAAAATRDPGPALSASLRGLGVPVADLVRSAVSARVAARGVAAGLVFAHHELRCPPRIGDALAPELDVAGGDPPTPEWQRGAFVAPKYFSAFLDAPLPAHDPSLRVKWRTHEIVHRLVGFLWRPDLTRFEAYLAARLGELLPVVHWYGLDELGRPRCARHRRRAPWQAWCPDCEAVRAAYWEDPVPVDVDEARAALEHLGTELAACVSEHRTGVLCPTPHPGLDASSDAIGYMRAHWNRITAWSFGAWVERFCRPGRDYVETAEAMSATVTNVFARLVAEPVVVASSDDARARRVAADLGYRVLMAIEATDDDRVEDELMPALDALAANPTPAVARTLLERMHRVLGTDAASTVAALGMPWLDAWPDDDGAWPEQLAHGLRSALPRSLADTADEVLIARARSFGADPACRGAGALGQRFAAFVAAHAGEDIDVPAVAFEAWLLAPPHVDAEAERFGVVPEDDASPAGARIRLNETARQGTFDAATVARVVDDFSGEGRVELLAVHYGAQPRVVALDPTTTAIVAAARDGRIAGPAADRRLLLETGVLAYFPAPR